MKRGRPGFGKLAALAAAFAAEKAASEIRVYDISGISGAAYFALLATVESRPQMNAVTDAVSAGLKRAAGACALYRDGMRSGSWRVLDYGGLIVHIFEPGARNFYAVDRLYEGCGTLDWRPKAVPAGGPGRPPAKTSEFRKK